MDNTPLPANAESLTFDSVSAQLKAPFAHSDIEWVALGHSKDRTRAMLVPLISIKAIYARLNDAVGEFNWKYWYEGAEVGFVKCHLVICGLEKIRAGFSEQSAFAKAAQAFGLGGRLERISCVWVDCDPANLKPMESEPKLPDWVYREFSTSKRTQGMVS